MKVFDIKHFVERAEAKHGKKYDYSKVEYVNAKTKVCIICPEHGEFWITPNSHINGVGCSKCSNNKKLTTEEFIIKAKKIHGNKYDYSKSEYINTHKKVCVVCPEHGEFWISPANHLRERGCPKCHTRKNLINNYIPENKTTNKKLTTEEFIIKAKKIHGDKYDYSKVEYVNNKTKVCIVCPKHGEFWQKPNDHLLGDGCLKCGIKQRFINRVKTIEQFIQDSRKIHGNKYDYSKVNYVNALTKVCIICPEHGEFWQTPGAHLWGNNCPKCVESHLENDVRVLLEHNNIKYEKEKLFDWLGKQRLDFYLPDYNIAIECQGIQHFKPIKHFGGDDKFKYTQKMDELKYKLCSTNGVDILYFSNVKRKNTITNLNILIKKIKQYGRNN